MSQLGPWPRIPTPVLRVHDCHLFYIMLTLCWHDAHAFICSPPKFLKHHILEHTAISGRSPLRPSSHLVEGPGRHHDFFLPQSFFACSLLYWECCPLLFALPAACHPLGFPFNVLSNQGPSPISLCKQILPASLSHSSMSASFLALTTGCIHTP